MLCLFAAEADDVVVEQAGIFPYWESSEDVSSGDEIQLLYDM
jgi:hypothetical protein